MAVIDSYSESNHNDDVPLYDVDDHRYRGQSAQPSDDYVLDTVQFYLSKTNSPTGSIYAQIYATTGVHGTSATCTGSPLATSDAFDCSTLSTSPALTEFTFSGANRITLSNGVCYGVILYAPVGDASNSVDIGRDTTSPSHAGNWIFYSGGSWDYNASNDACFYLNGTTYNEVSVNDSISLSESESVSLSDLSPDVYDSVSVVENVSMLMSSGYLFQVVDTVSATENVSLALSDLGIDVNSAASVSESIGLVYAEYIDVNDLVSITESVDLEVLVQADVNDSTSLSESVSLNIGVPIFIRELPVVYAPVAEMEGSFGFRLELDEKAPVAECSGTCGSELVENAPVAECEGTISSPTVLTLEQTAPVYSIECYFGSVLDVKAPTGECDVESYSNYISLDSNAPTARMEGTAFETAGLSLDKTAPFWSIDATLYGGSSELDATAPAWYALIEFLLVVGGDLDENAPVWEVLYEDMLIYCQHMEVDCNSPVGTMGEDTGMSDTEQGEGIYSSQFTDYILEYTG